MSPGSVGSRSLCRRTASWVACAAGWGCPWAVGSARQHPPALRASASRGRWPQCASSRAGHPLRRPRGGVLNPACRDPSDWARSFRLLQGRAHSPSPVLPAPNRSGQLLPSGPTASGGVGPILLSLAIHGVDANKSSRTRSPSPGAASPRGCPSLARTGCTQGPRGPRCVACRLSVWADQGARVVRRPPIVRQLQASLPCASVIPEGAVFGHAHKYSSIEEGGPPADRSRVSIGGSDQVAYGWCVNSLEMVSGSARHSVQAHGPEVVSLARMERPGCFVHLFSNRGLSFGRKGPQDGRDGSRYLGQEAPVVILVGKGPAKGDLLDLGLGKAGSHNQLPDAARISHGEDARPTGVGGRNMSLGHQDPSYQRRPRVALGSSEDGER